MPVTCKECGEEIFTTTDGRWVCLKCYEAQVLAGLPKETEMPDRNDQISRASRLGLGFDVWIRFKNPVSFRDLTEVTFHNATKVHWGFLTSFPPPKVTIESTVHATRATYPIDTIYEFIVTPATELAEEF